MNIIGKHLFDNCGENAFKVIKMHYASAQKGCNDFLLKVEVVSNVNSSVHLQNWNLK